ncbi:unnamed protein product [Symbiodinium natans]|uniref:Uncharacterized protein n=1 Tax=Symbiodinium natans TaxID=878477 RepID=A0A812L9J3_9DINO|nr:unnamed protein product [Symbiodinium natans]
MTEQTSKPYSLDGKVVLVTGASKPDGLGAAFVRAAVKKGAAKVYATGRKVEAVDFLVKECGDKVVGKELEVTNSASVHALAESCKDLQVLINSAGYMGHGGDTLLGGPMDEAERRKVFDVNIWGALSVSLAFAPILSANTDSSLIVVSSVGAFTNFGGSMAIYNATNAAKDVLTAGLSAELAGKVRVGSIYPGPVKTDMLKKGVVDDPKQAGYLDTAAEPQEFADAAMAYLEAHGPEGGIFGDELGKMCKVIRDATHAKASELEMMAY